MADKSLTVLSQALRLEQEGLAFYRQAAAQTQDAKGKAMFLSLADDEIKHAEMVQRQLHALEGSGAYVLLPDLEVESIDAGARLFAPEGLEKRLGDKPSDLQALHVALENEVASYNLYHAAAQDVEDPAGRQMYQWLAGAERTHFNLLMLNYESLADRGGWV